MSGLASRRIVERAAADVAAWNQMGCLSPHLIYVEEGGDLSAEQFAEALAKEMERREAAEPRGELPVESAAAIASRLAGEAVHVVTGPCPGLQEPWDAMTTMSNSLRCGSYCSL